MSIVQLASGSSVAPQSVGPSANGTGITIGVIAVAVASPMLVSVNWNVELPSTATRPKSAPSESCSAATPAGGSPEPLVSVGSVVLGSVGLLVPVGVDGSTVVGLVVGIDVSPDIVDVGPVVVPEPSDSVPPS